MERLSGESAHELFIAAALTSSQTRAGHICLDLSQLEDAGFLRENFGNDVHNLKIPSVEAMTSMLGKWSVVGQPGAFKPLILDDMNRLYLNRYWAYQNKLATFINLRTQNVIEPGSVESLREILNKYFSPAPGEEIDWQKIAAITATLKTFCVITGGPGTGKTHTVAKLLAVLLEQSGDLALKILLAAPTGKAAMRLQDSIRNVLLELDCGEEIKSAIPEEAYTIHRLLGTIRHSPYFRRHEKNRLDVDIMVIDEASMVDVALMSKLVEALPADAKLILLGDNNQLASVEAGAVLADICDTGRPHDYSREFITRLESVYGDGLAVQSADNHAVALQDCIVDLKKSYRFEEQRGIGALSRAVLAGDGLQALNLLKEAEHPEIEWHDLTKENAFGTLKNYFDSLITSSSLDEALSGFDKVRILCAVRQGPQGVETLNHQINQYVRRKIRARMNKEWYPNQPILVTQNDYNLGLYNGDLGIISPDTESNDELKVHFRQPDGSIRKIRPFRLPEHETAYALTVHKSQGSEFERVILLLPNSDTPILTRELIYTGITRATKKVEIWGYEDIFCAAVSRVIKRRSGLRDALWGVEKRIHP